MSRVLLSKIRSITLYKDELTKARRLPAIPQLTCIGSPCRLFQPDVVRCYNNGGEGVGGGGAISWGGGSRIRSSPSKFGIQPSGGMFTGGWEGDIIELWTGAG